MIDGLTRPPSLFFDWLAIALLLALIITTVVGIVRVTRAHRSR